MAAHQMRDKPGGLPRIRSGKLSANVQNLPISTTSFADIRKRPLGEKKTGHKVRGAMSQVIGMERRGHFQQREKQERGDHADSNEQVDEALLPSFICRR